MDAMKSKTTKEERVKIGNVRKAQRSNNEEREEKWRIYISNGRGTTRRQPNNLERLGSLIEIEKANTVMMIENITTDRVGETTKR